MIADFSIAPVGRGESLSHEIAKVYRLIDASGVAHEHHAMGTNLEGTWDDVLGLIRQCRDELLKTSSRVSITIKIDDRRGVTDGLSRKVESARSRMKRGPDEAP